MLKLARSGQVRICPHSGLSVTASGEGLMLATGAGALEIDYVLNQQAADMLITPDFNVALVGPGTFHFALGVNKKGDTCVKPLAWQLASEVTFSELLGTGVYKACPDQMVVFRGGKLDAKTALTGECGCPPTAPVMRAEVQPAPAPKEGSAESLLNTWPSPAMRLPHPCRPISQDKFTYRWTRPLYSAPDGPQGVLTRWQKYSFPRCQMFILCKKR